MSRGGGGGTPPARSSSSPLLLQLSSSTISADPAASVCRPLVTPRGARSSPPAPTRTRLPAPPPLLLLSPRASPGPPCRGISTAGGGKTAAAAEAPHASAARSSRLRAPAQPSLAPSLTPGCRTASASSSSQRRTRGASALLPRESRTRVACAQAASGTVRDRADRGEASGRRAALSKSHCCRSAAACSRSCVTSAA